MLWHVTWVYKVATFFKPQIPHSLELPLHIYVYIPTKLKTNDASTKSTLQHKHFFVCFLIKWLVSQSNVKSFMREAAEKK